MPQTMVRDQETITAAVVEKIADAEGARVYDVAPLFESVDPDALETIFADSAGDHVAVEFSHAGYRVRIEGGQVSIEASDDGS